MIRSWICYFLLSATAIQLRAQPIIDLVDLWFQAFNDRSSTPQYSAKLLLPLEVQNGNTLLAGLSYDQSVFRHEQDGMEAIKLTSASISMGAIKKLSPQWSIMGLVIPKVNAGLRDLDIKDLQLGGVIIATNKKSENLSYKIWPLLQ